MGQRQELVDWMRRNGVEHAEFDAQGNLLVCRLGPDPSKVAPKPEPVQRQPRNLLTSSVNGLRRGERIDG